MYLESKEVIFQLSQKIYIEKVFKIFEMHSCKYKDTSMAKGDKFGVIQCPKIYLEIQKTQKVLYASAIKSLMRARVFIRPNLVYIVIMLGRYLNNPVWIIRKQKTGYMRYLQRTKHYMLTSRKIRSFGEIIRHSLILIVLDANIVNDPFLSYICLLAVEPFCGEVLSKHL